MEIHNVEIKKEKKPKDWSYPLKSSETLIRLELVLSRREIGAFTLYYDNTRPGYTRPHNQKQSFSSDYFRIFSIEKTVKGFFMTVHLCKPEYRKKIHDIIVNEVFSIVKPWLKIVKQPCHLMFEYHLIKFPDGKYGMGLELLLAGRQLWTKKIEFEKEMGM